MVTGREGTGIAKIMVLYPVKAWISYHAYSQLLKFPYNSEALISSFTHSEYV